MTLESFELRNLVVVVGWCSTWSSSRTSSWHLFVVLQQVEISFDLSSRLRVDQAFHKCKPLVIVVVLLIVAVVVLVDVLVIVGVVVLGGCPRDRRCGRPRWMSS